MTVVRHPPGSTALKKYIVTLTAEERQALGDLIAAGEGMRSTDHAWKVDQASATISRSGTDFRPAASPWHVRRPTTPGGRPASPTSDAAG